MATLRKNASRKNSTTALEPSLRHAWLASLGLLVAARRESKAAAQRAASKMETAMSDARIAMKRAEADVRGGIEGVRGQVQPKVVKFSSEVEARLAPVLDKLGLKPKQKRAARKTRKPVVKQPVPRRAARKTGKRPVKQAAR